MLPGVSARVERVSQPDPTDLADPRVALARSPLQFRYLGLREGTHGEYRATWDEQKRVHAQVSGFEIGPQVLYVEHEHVFTAGRRTEPGERPFDGTPVVDVDRGGKITYHGPGQLVGYPIVWLGRVGVVDYVRRGEEAIIALLADYGIASGRVRDRTGVWLVADEKGPERKICAIGIRVARQTTLHGFALNVDPDMGWFDRIVPCGIRDAGVTSMAFELGRAPALVEVAERLEPHLSTMLAFEPYEQSPDIASFTLGDVTGAFG